MSEDYENIEWNVHATSDALTSYSDKTDPLTSFSSNTPYEHQFNDTTEATLYPEPFISQSPPPPISSPITPYKTSLDNTSLTSTKQLRSPTAASYASSSSSSIYNNNNNSNSNSNNINNNNNNGNNLLNRAYVSYLVSTTTSVETFSSTNPRPVRRRFQDFVWLYSSLSLEYVASIVPPLPEKHRLEYIKGDRFSSDFIERRRLCLQWFLDRIAKHPVLQQSQCTRLFLESTDFKNDKRIYSRQMQSSSTVLDSLSDSLVNAFTKVKKPDEKFVMMRDNIEKLEDNLNTVERLYTRISKRQYDLQQDYTSFGQSIQGLSSLESAIHQPLHQFAEATKTYSKAMKTRSDKEEILYLNRVHEILSYCRSAKAVLRERDQKQVDFEQLSGYLQQAINDKERIKHPGRSLHDNGSINISELLLDKIKEVRGVDMELDRREKLIRLELKIKELQEEVAKASDMSQAFSEQVVNEYAYFQDVKASEIKSGLTAYADSHIEFYQKGISIWENILPILENIDVDNNQNSHSNEEDQNTEDKQEDELINDFNESDEENNIENEEKTNTYSFYQ
ncbi:unnamed protein product [Cunninghamella echinulata]